MKGFDIALSNNVHYDSNQNIRSIDVNGYKKQRIWKIFCCLSPSYTQFNWKPIYIHYGRVCFFVFYTEDYPGHSFVIRPARRYQKIEFEQLFGFDFKCRGYTEDRMISLHKIEEKI